MPNNVEKMVEATQDIAQDTGIKTGRSKPSLRKQPILHRRPLLLCSTLMTTGLRAGQFVLQLALEMGTFAFVGVR